MKIFVVALMASLLSFSSYAGKNKMSGDLEILLPQDTYQYNTDIHFGSTVEGSPFKDYVTMVSVICRNSDGLLILDRAKAVDMGYDEASLYMYKSPVAESSVECTAELLYVERKGKDISTYKWYSLDNIVFTLED